MTKNDDENGRACLRRKGKSRKNIGVRGLGDDRSQSLRQIASEDG